MTRNWEGVFFSIMLDKEYWSFQRGLMGSPRCKGCSEKCEILYDSHHDQYFGLYCGIVIMEMGVFCVDYDDNLDKIFHDYDVRFAEYHDKVRKKLEKKKGRL